MRRPRLVALRCQFYDDGCCGDPDDDDYCGLCPLASADHPDRNGGWPGKPVVR